RSAPRCSARTTACAITWTTVPAPPGGAIAPRTRTNELAIMRQARSGTCTLAVETLDRLRALETAAVPLAMPQAWLPVGTSLGNGGSHAQVPVSRRLPAPARLTGRRPGAGPRDAEDDHDHHPGPPGQHHHGQDPGRPGPAGLRQGHRHRVQRG